MSQAMIDYWVGFAYGPCPPPLATVWQVGAAGADSTIRSGLFFVARSPPGNVNREAVVPWPTLDTTSESLLLLNTPIAQTQYNSEECNFWVRSRRCMRPGGGASGRRLTAPHGRVLPRRRERTGLGGLHLLSGVAAATGCAMRLSTSLCNVPLSTVRCSGPVSLYTVRQFAVVSIKTFRPARPRRGCRVRARCTPGVVSALTTTATWRP